MGGASAGESKLTHFCKPMERATAAGSTSGWDRGFGPWDGIHPSERSRRTQPTRRVRLCGPAYPKGVGVIQGGVYWKSENPPKTLPKLSEILPPSLKTLPKLSENHAVSNPKTV